MLADPTLLQMKYSRIVIMFADKCNIPVTEALDFFYHSLTYKLISEGISYMHCMSDEYLVEELADEFCAK